ncbi:DUF932 domain-containing protein [Nitrospirillum amazonense]|uniref:DUF932 domain-containing protein n=1 Tax=Nitrospirillum amazonense TaxID=28077 RepID=UPI002DD434E0|nr:DUF932 domain-containing protein [Nitrospirillum amazonense]MEC4594824.1 DUF932 domain-containing protein [Nitrospirillum amazonense]
MSLVTQTLDAAPVVAPVAAPFKVDVTRGRRVGRVSSEWFSRPADERYLSLADLYDAVRDRADRSRTRTVESRHILVEAHRDDPDSLALRLPGDGAALAPTHWSFGQLAGLVGAPAGYLRQLPAPLAGINLQYGLTHHRAEQVKTLETDDGRLELRAVTGPDYGCIHDHELVAAVRAIAGNGTGDTRWKVPGTLDWSTMSHNPHVDISAETTTLYASDRDVFLFLVDDTHPIEAGRLADGSPDLYFRGFYCWNSEVGSKTLGIASFFLRGVCQNRNLWGVEGLEEITIRHSKYAAGRFAHQAAPALERFAASSPAGFIAGIKAARDTIVATQDEERTDFLSRRAGLGRQDAARVIETVLREEGKLPESVFDFIQGITAVARAKGHQDARLDLEQKAKRLMDKVAA